MLLDDLTAKQYWDLRREHKTNLKIAEALHVSVHTLYKRTIVLGINGQVMRKVVNDRRKKEKDRVLLMNKMRNEGHSPAEIMKALGFTNQKTYYAFRSTVRKRGYTLS